MIDWNAVLSRVAPSLVELEVADKEGGPFRTPGVASDEWRFAAWAGLSYYARDDGARSAVSARQGERRWTGGIDDYCQEWATCAVSTKEPHPLPPLAARLSKSLTEYEEVGVIGCADGLPVVVTRGVLKCGKEFTAAGRPYEQFVVWGLEVETPLQSSGALAIDAEGRLGGLIEKPFDDGSNVALLPSEFLLRLGSGLLIHMARKSGLLREAVALLKDRVTDPWAYCAGGLAYEGLGNLEAAKRAWQRAIELDPEGRWPHEQIARVSGG